MAMFSEFPWAWPAVLVFGFPGSLVAAAVISALAFDPEMNTGFVVFPISLTIAFLQAVLVNAIWVTVRQGRKSHDRATSNP